MWDGFRMDWSWSKTWPGFGLRVNGGGILIKGGGLKPGVEPNGNGMDEKQRENAIGRGNIWGGAEVGMDWGGSLECGMDSEWIRLGKGGKPGLDLDGESMVGGGFIKGGA